jgi:hypothetical protein
VHPDSALRSLVVAAPEVSDAEALALVQRAAARMPAAPHVQLELGRALFKQGMETEGAEANAALDAAVGAFIRSLWDAPVSGTAMLELVEAVDSVYEPDPGVGDRPLYDLMARAAALAPLNSGVQLDIADWYLKRWSSLPPDVRQRTAEQIEAALALSARAPELSSHRQAVQAAYERALAQEPASAVLGEPRVM